ncbi:hypothetical protein N7467_006750 [Penicillium canescens]|nr:hypothetical protein N7467_006750 [Penicillium canescens]
MTTEVEAEMKPSEGYLKSGAIGTERGLLIACGFKKSRIGWVQAGKFLKKRKNSMAGRKELWVWTGVAMGMKCMGW